MAYRLTNLRVGVSGILLGLLDQTGGFLLSGLEQAGGAGLGVGADRIGAILRLEVPGERGGDRGLLLVEGFDAPGGGLVGAADGGAVPGLCCTAHDLDSKPVVASLQTRARRPRMGADRDGRCRLLRAARRLRTGSSRCQWPSWRAA